MAASKQLPLVAPSGATTSGSSGSILSFAAHRGGYVRAVNGYAEVLTDPDAAVTFDVIVEGVSVLRAGVACNELNVPVTGRLIKRPRFERGQIVSLTKEGTGSAGVAAGWGQLVIEYDQ